MVQEKVASSCYHCGEDCKSSAPLHIEEKVFCCNGCLNVYQILNQHEMSDYYCLNETPGQKVKQVAKEQFAFLDEASVIDQLLTFKSASQAQVVFFLPQMHCSSCLWLLEHLSNINENIIQSQVNFNKKTILVSFKIDQFSLRSLAELLTHIGYEPCIDLHAKQEPATYDSKRSYLKVGITGFCFANIMLISFPEYLGLAPASQPALASFFKWTNLLLSIPVVFYGAKEFFVNAWYSIRQRYLNIDAPIALAVAVTFLRSVYEIASGTGAGYFDSMAGIVFFMLLGRTLQNRSYTTLRFNRDYKSYFPIAVTKIENNQKSLVTLEAIEENSVLLIHHQEVIPTDCLVSKGNAQIDYSFVSGEQKPEHVAKGAIIYAGGKNVGDAIEVVTVKAFSQNSFTQLWNSSAFSKKYKDKDSRVTIISKYFSLIVLLTSLSAFIGWQLIDASISWKAATAVLIVACPCALLLTASFTNGYLLEKFAQFGCYLKNANVLEALTKIDHIAFDKTGTLTEADAAAVQVKANKLSEEEFQVVLNAMAQSMHPLSRAVVQHFDYQSFGRGDISVKECPGLGLEVWAEEQHYKIGSSFFVLGEYAKELEQTTVWVSVDGQAKAQFVFAAQLRDGASALIRQLGKEFKLSLISGDNAATKGFLAQVFKSDSDLFFNMKPQDKLDYIQDLQQKGEKVMMVGDGLNDAGALKQSDVGLAVVKNAFSFSPACDMIMEADKLSHLPAYLKWAKGGQRLINIGFAYSIIFNIIGLAFAITGQLSPLVAAILMPSSSLGIILIAFLGVNRMTKNGKQF